MKATAAEPNHNQEQIMVPSYKEGRLVRDEPIAFDPENVDWEQWGNEGRALIEWIIDKNHSEETPLAVLDLWLLTASEEAVLWAQGYVCEKGWISEKVLEHILNYQKNQSCVEKIAVEALHKNAPHGFDENLANMAGEFLFSAEERLLYIEHAEKCFESIITRVDGDQLKSEEELDEGRKRVINLLREHMLELLKTPLAPLVELYQDQPGEKFLLFIRMGSWPGAQRVLESGFDVNQLTKAGDPSYLARAFQLAMRYRHTGVLVGLIKQYNGLDWQELCDDYGNNVLNWALRYDYFQVIAALVEKGYHIENEVITHVTGKIRGALETKDPALIVQALEYANAMSHAFRKNVLLNEGELNTELLDLAIEGDVAEIIAELVYNDLYLEQEQKKLLVGKLLTRALKGDKSNITALILQDLTNYLSLPATDLLTGEVAQGNQELENALQKLKQVAKRIWGVSYTDMWRDTAKQPKLNVADRAFISTLNATRKRLFQKDNNASQELVNRFKLFVENLLRETLRKFSNWTTLNLDYSNKLPIHNKGLLTWREKVSFYITELDASLRAMQQSLRVGDAPFIDVFKFVETAGEESEIVSLVCEVHYFSIKRALENEDALGLLEWLWFGSYRTPPRPIPLVGAEDYKNPMLSLLRYDDTELIPTSEPEDIHVATCCGGPYDAIRIQDNLEFLHLLNEENMQGFVQQRKEPLLLLTWALLHEYPAIVAKIMRDFPELLDDPALRWQIFSRAVQWDNQKLLESFQPKEKGINDRAMLKTASHKELEICTRTLEERMENPGDVSLFYSYKEWGCQTLITARTTTFIASALTLLGLEYLSASLFGIKGPTTAMGTVMFFTTSSLISLGCSAALTYYYLTPKISVIIDNYIERALSEDSEISIA
jgi:hypothetical protein